MLGAEVGAALGILGLLLVFLPLFLASLADAKTPAERRARRVRAWSVPALIAIAAMDASLGILTLWESAHAAKPTGYMLLALVWLVFLVSVVAVKDAA